MRIALVLGGAQSLHFDLSSYFGPFHGVVACNEAGFEWPGKLDAWASLHPDYFTRKGWLKERSNRGYPDPAQLFGVRAKGIEVPTTITPWQFPGMENVDASLSSGLFAAKVALVDLGFDQVVLCGVPMNTDPHFFEPGSWASGSRYAKRLGNIPREYADRIRSMSGTTMQFFGNP